MTEFTPLASLFGGALIGLSAVLLLALEGRLAGVSGIAGRLVSPDRTGAPLSAFAFLVGLVAAPFLAVALTGQSVVQVVSSNLPLMALAGLLVGFGAAYGGGCTSGHGVCGIARLSRRSLVATAIFMTTAIVTVFISRHAIGG